MKKKTGTVEKNTIICYIVGTTSTKDSGYYAVNAKLKIAEISFTAIGTGASLSPGRSYALGSVAPLGIKPLGAVRCDANRCDTGQAPATLEITSTGDIRLEPLANIPSGVNLRAHVMYFYE